MIHNRLQNFNVVTQITDWIKAHSSNTYTISHDLQLVTLDESIEAFLTVYPDTTVAHENEIKWILKKWISNMTVMPDFQTGEVMRYRGVELSANRYNDIRQHLLNETRKMVSHCCKARTIN